VGGLAGARERTVAWLNMWDFTEPDSIFFVFSDHGYQVRTLVGTDQMKHVHARVHRVVTIACLFLMREPRECFFDPATGVMTDAGAYSQVGSEITPKDTLAWALWRDNTKLPRSSPVPRLIASTDFYDTMVDIAMKSSISISRDAGCTIAPPNASPGTYCILGEKAQKDRVYIGEDARVKDSPMVMMMMMKMMTINTLG
jgi:hypothetical protein